ncbi:4-hydroxy-tetrahydrodipicolinate synthase [Thermococcus barophilus]|uniref:4-hydroxy-tetrahydrodipicolinate synthase n=1 Tax=Thermococcus barophilus TaxID=55802 RepID=A0A0S1XA48_THEBA|nr:4-hydroxy-tetrahydrodipicolinate synthase [Thermococcus barophilus]ALM74647.1 Dihydrodipicolinate synthetase [Thermococcus barophilus]
MFKGVITPFITPFTEKLEIDFDAIKWLVEYQIRNGVDGIFPNSTTGEFVHLTKEESIKVVEAVMESSKSDVWIIPGISQNCTLRCIELGKIFEDLGVDGAIVTPPFFFKPSTEQLKLHFSMIAERLSIPLIIYNIPSTTGVVIPVGVYKELAQEYSNIAGAKVTYGNFEYFRNLVQEVKSIRKDFSILTGMDTLLLPLLEIGGDGGIMALANVLPQIHKAVYTYWKERKYEKAIEANSKLMQLVRIYDIASSFPTAVKTALHVLGTPIKPYVRPPLTQESKEVERKIKNILEIVKGNRNL